MTNILQLILFSCFKSITKRYSLNYTVLSCVCSLHRIYYHRGTMYNAHWSRSVPSWTTTVKVCILLISFVFDDDPDNQMLRLLPDSSWLQPINELINVRIWFYCLFIAAHYIVLMVIDVVSVADRYWMDIWRAIIQWLCICCECMCKLSCCRLPFSFG